jgi:cytochrome c
MREHRFTLSVGAALLLAHAAAGAGGNPAKGADYYAEECGDCHSVSPGKNKKGPSLFGVIGRQPGSVADFSGYSEAMKQLGGTWSAERVDAYIAQPRKLVPGGKMKYDGLADAQERADIAAYLASLK